MIGQTLKKETREFIKEDKYHDQIIKGGKVCIYQTIIKKMIYKKLKSL